VKVAATPCATPDRTNWRVTSIWRASARPVGPPDISTVSPTRAGLLLFSAAVLAGPWYTVDGYSVVRNVVSELGAQHTPNSLVMVAGFLALGGGIVADGLRNFQRMAVPFIAFGVFMGLAGLFAHKPLDPSVPFTEALHAAHSVLASLAGVSVTVGLIWYGVRVGRSWRRTVALALAALCVALPLAMLAFPAYQGLIQRVMYLLIFAWVWVFFPDLRTANTPPNGKSGDRPPWPTD
jgi:hypothetical protein